MRANSAPQLGFGFADMVSAVSALEKLFKIGKISVRSALKIFHKNSMQIYENLIRKLKISLQKLYFDYIIWYNKTKLTSCEIFFKEVIICPIKPKAITTRTPFAHSKD